MSLQLVRAKDGRGMLRPCSCRELRPRSPPGRDLSPLPSLGPAPGMLAEEPRTRRGRFEDTA